jgi:Ankyrin repeats (3 copies)
MFSWLDQLAQTVAPPPTDAVGRFLYSIQRNDEANAMNSLSEMVDPIYTVIQPSKGTYAIHLACQHGMENIIRQLLTTPGSSTEQLDSLGNTSLHYACLNTNSRTALTVVKLLVQEFRASVTAKNSTGQTPYDVASGNSVRQYLLPLQLQKETQNALDNGGVGLPPGIDLGGLRISNSNLPPPPSIGGGAVTPSHTYAPPIFTTPSPSMPTVSSAPSTASLAGVNPNMASIPPLAPTSGPHTYARSGHSSAAIAAASKYRPDGFHSSSSDINLAKKYGNINSGNAPLVLPPPPSSGNLPPTSHATSMAVTTGSNPFSAAVSSHGNPFARGPVVTRYLAYDGTTVPTPSVSVVKPPPPPIGNYTVFYPLSQQAKSREMPKNDHEASYSYDQQQYQQTYDTQSVNYNQTYDQGQKFPPPPSPYAQSNSQNAGGCVKASEVNLTDNNLGFPAPPYSTLAPTFSQSPLSTPPIGGQANRIGTNANSYQLPFTHNSSSQLAHHLPVTPISRETHSAVSPAAVFASPPSGNNAIGASESLASTIPLMPYASPSATAIPTSGVNPAVVFGVPPVLDFESTPTFVEQSKSSQNAHDLFSSTSSPVADPQLEQTENAEQENNNIPFIKEPGDDSCADLQDVPLVEDSTSESKS